MAVFNEWLFSENAEGVTQLFLIVAEIMSSKWLHKTYILFFAYVSFLFHSTDSK